jgi:hypothetical protein
MVSVEITSIDLDHLYIEVNGKRVHQTRSPLASVGIRITGEMVKAEGKADLNEEERSQLRALVIAIEERLMREFGA